MTELEVNTTYTIFETFICVQNLHFKCFLLLKIKVITKTTFYLLSTDN